VRREKRGPGETGTKPCCMVSEILEEAGIDRARARQIRRQVLEGIILMCQWQLQRMEQDREAQSHSAGRRGRKVEVE
jgi:hypothetical protein